jgi:hypothetical protein
MRKVLFSLLIGPVGLLAGCMADAQVGYRQPTVMVAAQPAVVVEPAYVPPPGPEPVLVEVNPGVQVVQDYDYPVFFSDGLYWRNDGGIWMSSRYHTGGWIRNERVPVGVRGINHPEGYAHYRAGVTVHEGGGAVVRENGGMREGVTVHEGGGAVVRENGGVREGVTVHEGATVREGGGAVVHEGGGVREGVTVHEGATVREGGGATVGVHESGSANVREQAHMSPERPATVQTHQAPPSRPPPVQSHPQVTQPKPKHK